VQTIPLNNLKRVHDAIAQDLRDAIGEVAATNHFAGGPACAHFAAQFATYCGVDFCVPCASGTDALYLALRAALGLGDGEREVITVSHTFVATAEAIANAGYQPVLVDVDPRTYLIDLEQVEAAIGPKTAGIVPVHLYGQMVPMLELMDIARRHSLVVIEDAAQCHGARYNGYRPGELSDAAAFSFYPGKNLGAWGDAGAVVTRRGELVETIKRLADHGRVTHHRHDDVGINSRMDTIQAAILSAKLPYLDAWNQQRRDVAGWYRSLLGDDGTIVLPHVDPTAEPVYHQFVIQVDDRDAMLEHLKAAGVGAGIHYPIPVHEQPAFRFLGYEVTDLPVTHKLCRRILSLPVFPGMTPEEAETVCDAVRATAAAR
jgi:dTDP-4-amino-4,6-dideoxygalactose transaminase